MKRIFCVLLFIWGILASPVFCLAQAPLGPVTLLSPVQDKNFYLLSLMERTPAVNEALAKDPELLAIAKAKQRTLVQSETACKGNSGCSIDAALLTPAEIDLCGKRLQKIYAASPAARTLVAGPMRRSGFFKRYKEDTDAALLVHAWTDAAKGIDQILETYGKGIPPRYPKIDSVSLDVNSPAYWQQLHGFTEKLAQKPAKLFFQPSLDFALLLLNANQRDEAGRFEPLETGENATALGHIPAIQWSSYRYSVIVVPGQGPEEPDVALDSRGRARLALAAANYRAGMAPLILVSGGFVHPSQTRFCEAIEMKMALIADFHIPADAILVDPHARHTTTNIRNATRLIYHYGIPFDKPALITTDTGQSADIESAGFIARNQRELGYVPYRSLTRISPTDLSFLPEIDSLQMDAGDPLDP